MSVIALGGNFVPKSDVMTIELNRAVVYIINIICWLQSEALYFQFFIVQNIIDKFHSILFSTNWLNYMILEWNLPKKLVNGKYFEKLRLYQISVNLENLSFWDHICLKTFHGGVLRHRQPGDNFFLARKCYKMASFRWFQVDSGWF